MKKCVALILSLLLVLACCACNDSDTKENVACYLLDVNNSAPGAEINIPDASESKWWNGISFESDSAKKEMTIELGGKTYTGSYICSYYDNYNSFATDYYGGEDGVYFGINANSGKLAHLSLETRSFYVDEPLLPEKSGIEDESAKIAREIASQFADISDYEVDLKVRPYQPDKSKAPQMSYYEYTYTKPVNGENSTAFITVYVTSKGNVALVSVGDVDAFNGEALRQAKAYKNIDLDEVVLDTMKEITKNLESPTCKINAKYYLLTPDGEIVAVVRAGCEYYKEIDGELSNETSVMACAFVVK